LANAFQPGNSGIKVS